MENGTNMRTLFIIVNAGFSDEVINIARGAGVRGATIINARGEGAQHESFLGITVDTEKEIIFSVADEKTAEKAMLVIKEKAGIKTPAHSICFSLPVEKAVGLKLAEPKNEIK